MMGRIYSRQSGNLTPFVYLVICSLFLLTCNQLTGPEEFGLSVSPESLYFGKAYHSLPLRISTSEGGPFEWRILEKPEWLTVSPSSGTSHHADTSLQVTVTRSNMKDGDYTSTIAISSDDDKISIPVSMKVDGPYMLVSETELDFSTNFTTLSLVISNIGNGIIEYQITTLDDWITVSPVAGEVASQPQEVDVSVDRTGLSWEEYSSELAIQSNEKKVWIAVTLTVPPDG